jgi:Zn-dependent M28 family amino/carboxypeptidase
MKRIVSTLLIAFTMPLAAQTASLPPGAEEAAGMINRASLEAPIRFLADDLLEGRGPATRGDELARLYLVRELQALGLEPGAGNGEWQQPFDVVSIATGAPDTWTFHTKGGDVSVKKREDFIASSGMQGASTSLKDAELVFVGYGIEAPEYKWNDFAKVDVKGKVLVVMNNDPDWDPKLFAGNRRLYYGRWSYKYEQAARKGAAGVIIIHTTPSAGYPWQVVQSSWSGEQFELPAESEPRLQVKSWMTDTAMRTLLKSAGYDLDKLVASARSSKFKAVPLGIRTSLDLNNTITKKKTANVAGLLRGSDPALKEEVVVYTAHHDHFGIGDPDASGDKIYNGAEDNAAGCAQVLAMAKAFSALPKAPKRSILFLFVAAEEQGLLGSGYYATHPSIAPGRIAANINIDGGNIWGRTSDLSQVGRGKSSLDAVVEGFAKQQGRQITEEEFPDRGFFYRSDQFNLAKIGIPALYFHSGVHLIGKPEGEGKRLQEEWEEKIYHQPSDQVESWWNFDGMVDDARLYFFTGLAIAENPVLPTWNKGDEFEAARLKALAAVAK